MPLPKPTPGALGLVIAALALPAIGQPQGHAGHGPAPGGAQAPYAGLQGREIKALSELQLAELRAGKGMSLALAAELNGYPGPSHVLELAAPLQLSAEQLARTRQLHGEMQQQARAGGEAVIAAERALDALFRERQVHADNLAQAIATAAAAHGRLRETHLRHHLAMRALLTPEQLATYTRLRGY